MDLIDRQDALNAIHDLKNKLKFIGDANYRMCIQVIKSVPSAQKTGKWITKSNTTPYYTEWWYECSECGQRPLRDVYGQDVLSDYCPNCGTRMECEEE